MMFLMLVSKRCGHLFIFNYQYRYPELRRGLHMCDCE